ncbi:hypothetical protein FSP39_024256 [Pinctada imbricata]|uniref:Uncharacterized protein n=1 Tax=Pinctada imbricata TaxID=66713 RepID=A0AA88XYC6_PINIB|nr:hypothetical protein FSP39_024256 [Pinctada imbricata]
MADVASVFPKMQDRRLSLIGKQLNRVRKTTSITNDKLKDRCSRYGKAMDRDKKSYQYKIWQKRQPLQRNFVHARGTMKCLKKHRDMTLVEDDPAKPYGMYGGMSLKDLHTEIECVIRDSHPRVRRIRRADKLLTDGRHDGRILGNREAREQLEIILNRPVFPKKRERGLYPPFRPCSVDSNELTSASGLRLPPIQVSRENTRDRLLGRPMSKRMYGGRASTFAFEPNTVR